MDNFINAKGQLERNAASTDRLDVMVVAMWELMLDKGFTREQLNAKLDKIKEQKITLDPQYNRVICPDCGRIVNESQTKPFEGKCIYCGHEVMIYPGDSIEFTKDDETIPVQQEDL